MSITVKEALEFESFKRFVIVAGEKGLSNNIKRIGILDYEVNDWIEKNFVEGEFIISTLLVIKNRIEELYGIVEKMISLGLSGLAIKNIYFNKIPDDVMKLADENKFPIMIFSETYFEDIILEVTNALKEKEEIETISYKIDSILYNNLDSTIIRRIAYEINRNFREKHIAAFCKRRNDDSFKVKKTFFDKEGEKSSNKIIPYRDGYVFINTFDDIDDKNIAAIMLQRLEISGFSTDKYIIGISNLYDKLGELNMTLKESIYAFNYSLKYQKDISFFNEIGINKILLPLIDNHWIHKYHDEIIGPLIKYDKKNDTELLLTAVKFIENNGDIKSTAVDLHQHSNTIRYRIEKVRKILSEYCSSGYFYEELAVAVRIYNLLNIPL